MQVADVARQHEAHDRAPAVGQDLVAAGVARHEDVQQVRILAAIDEVGAREHVPRPGDERVEARAVGGAEVRALRQPREGGVVHRLP